MSARIHPQASGRALAASAAGTKSGRNLFKRQLTQREFELEQEHRRLDLFEYLVSFNAEQAAKRDDGDVAPSRIEESLQKAAESCPMASAIRRARLVARPRRKAGRAMRCVRGDVLRRHRERARRHDGEFSQRACWARRVAIADPRRDLRNGCGPKKNVEV